MRIWIDSTTPKSLRLAVAVMERFPDHEYVHTARDGWEMRGMAGILNLEPLFVGRHGRTREEKLRCSITRQQALLKEISDWGFDLLYSHCSIEAIRTASALGIPIASTNDSPWSRWVERLTIPLVDHHITPFYTWEMWKLKPKEKRTLYKGLDEWAWIKPLYHASSWDYSTWWDDWEPRYVLTRELEHGSNYLDEDLRFDGFSGPVKHLPRYDGETFEDSLELLKGAACTVGVGGTINREAALLGVPSVLVRVKPWVTGIYGYLQTIGPAFLAGDASQGMKWMDRFMGKTLHALPLDKTITKKLQSPLDALGKVLDGG